MTDPRRAIPGVDTLLESSQFGPLLERYPRARVLEAARVVVERVRAALENGEDSDVSQPGLYADGVTEWLARADVPSLRRVVNATGVVLHTNLGRAPLALRALEAMTRAGAGYANLEYDLGEGRRGSRYDHCVRLLSELTGSEDALVVNNAAAGLLLALTAVAQGRGVVVSRGELIEVGGGFRIPEVLGASGARLVEVGSTNRTRPADYEGAIAAGGVGAILKVHRSNFRIAGFTEEAGLSELRAVADRARIPLVYDLGSGLMVEPEALGLPPEPRAAQAVELGADVVVVSGDKLMGGPQAGIVVGRADLVGAMRGHPLCRALRVDKVTLAGLEATLGLYRDPRSALAEIPVLRMLAAPIDALEKRARGLADRLGEAGVRCDVAPGSGAVGGGTYPEIELASWTVRLRRERSAEALTRALRDGDPPIVARIDEGAVVLDVRTVLEEEDDGLPGWVAEASQRTEEEA